MEDQAQVDVLAVVLDVNPLLAQARAEDVCAPSLYEDLLVFFNAFLLGNPDNVLSVVTCDQREATFVHPAPEAGAGTGNTERFATMEERIVRRLRASAEASMRAGPHEPSDGPLLVGGLSLALAWLQRMRREHPHAPQRVLVLSTSPDTPAQYIHTMNCVFDAQRSKVPVDAVVLAPGHSTFLQQVCSLSGGLYLKPTTEPLIQLLLNVFLWPAPVRAQLHMPQQQSVDFRASCFCHKRPVEIGHVCSVCLSIFCEFHPVCSTCGAKIDFK